MIAFSYMDNFEYKKWKLASANWGPWCFENFAASISLRCITVCCSNGFRELSDRCRDEYGEATRDVKRAYFDSSKTRQTSFPSSASYQRIINVYLSAKNRATVATCATICHLELMPSFDEPLESHAARESNAQKAVGKSSLSISLQLCVARRFQCSARMNQTSMRNYNRLPLPRHQQHSPLLHIARNFAPNQNTRFPRTVDYRKSSILVIFVEYDVGQVVTRYCAIFSSVTGVIRFADSA